MARKRSRSTRRPTPILRPARGRRRYTLTRLGNLDRVQGWIPLNRKLGLKAMGITVASFPAGEGYEHPHIHAKQEEIYLLAHGRGQMAIDGKVIDLKAGDIVRVDPPAVRALRSHPSSPSVWVMVGATPGLHREKDYTELTDQPAGF
jgi:mannose-6-phosphate isomerase-like protein (cupin superfamily)